MSTPLDEKDLRDVTEEVILGLSALTHRDLDDLPADLGLSIPPQSVGEGGADAAPGLTKRQRLQAAFNNLDSREYPEVLARFLNRGDLPPELLHRVEDLVWARQQWPEITERVRREIAKALEQAAPIWENADGLMALLGRIWVLRTDLDFWAERGGLAADIERHMIRNPDDWTVLDFFTRVGALGCSDRRFALFIEGLLSGSVNPNEERQRALVEAITPALSQAGLKVIEIGSTGGYPDFSIVRTGTRARPPTLILFASTSRKPDLRLSEVLDQQVEVMSGASDVLRYDQPIPEQGLTWNQLQTWWAQREGISVDDAKRSLWNRLRAAIPASSPPQLALFEEYHRLYGQQNEFLALLPEVWLHWDPIAKSVRGDRAMLTQRMDFLMLLPSHRRVVLEVDGAQHYSIGNRPSPARYSETTRADRDLRLSGYEVYRFSGYELSGTRSSATISEFFSRLLG